MKLDYLKPGMVIVTKHLLIADLYEDTNGSLMIELRHPEKYKGDYADPVSIVTELQPELQPQYVDRVYNNDNISLKHPDLDTPSIYIDDSVKLYDIYGIFMLFDRPMYKERHDGDTIKELFNSRSLLYIEPNDKLAYNIVEHTQTYKVSRVYESKGTPIRIMGKDDE